MKEDIMRAAIGNIDEKLIEGAEKEPGTGGAKVSWLKWGSVAAAAVLIAVTGVTVLPGMLKGNGPADTPVTTQAGGNEGGEAVLPGNEAAPYSRYKYSVDEGKYSSYVQGKVIAARHVGEKLEDVTVTAGWVYMNGGECAARREERHALREEHLLDLRWQIADEHARAEIYEIKGVSTDTAVAIKFLDKLEAQITDTYYVIMNPEADLTPVSVYVINEEAFSQQDGLE